MDAEMEVALAVVVERALGSLDLERRVTMSLPDPNTFDGGVAVKDRGTDDWRALPPVIPPSAEPGSMDQYRPGGGRAHHEVPRTGLGMSAKLGVGFIGAGPVTQAIHLPTLATLAEHLRVVRVVDVDKDVAAAVADRVDARASTDVQVLLDDPAVEVVCICSPHQFYADQATAAC